MRLAEIKKKYRNQWVLVEFSKLDKDLRVKDGKVLAHASNKEDIYKALLQTRGKNVSIEYCGELPQDLVVMFCSKLHVDAHWASLDRESRCYRSSRHKSHQLARRHSTFTILPVEVLESIGLSPAESKEHERIATGSGYIIAPKLRVRTFNTLGKEFRRVVVIAHTLPFGGPIDGLLGMDILCRMKAKIATAAGLIDVE